MDEADREDFEMTVAVLGLRGNSPALLGKAIDAGYLFFLSNKVSESVRRAYQIWCGEKHIPCVEIRRGNKFSAIDVRLGDAHMRFSEKGVKRLRKIISGDNPKEYLFPYPDDPRDTLFLSRIPNDEAESRLASIREVLREPETLEHVEEEERWSHGAATVVEELRIGPDGVELVEVRPSLWRRIWAWLNR